MFGSECRAYDAGPAASSLHSSPPLPSSPHLASLAMPAISYVAQVQIINNMLRWYEERTGSYKRIGSAASLPAHSGPTWALLTVELVDPRETKSGLSFSFLLSCKLAEESREHLLQVFLEANISAVDS
jgi:hypothetical protein